MINVPTELLRTFVAVIDLRSFTKAAHALGVTQPAVSAQIKRLQMLLGGELLDKSAPGVTLTAKGEIVVNYARRLLAINDQILDLTAAGPVVDRIRIGLAVDYFETAILRAITGFRAAHPEMRVQVCADYSDSLLRDLRRGEFDLIVALTDTVQDVIAKRSWTETTVWAAASAEMFERDGPVPLATLSETSLGRRLSVALLEQFGRPYEHVYTGKSFSGVLGAVRAGHGMTCGAKRLMLENKLEVLERSARLPKLPDLLGGVYLREEVTRAELDELADAIAAVVSSPETAAQRTQHALMQS